MYVLTIPFLECGVTLKIFIWFPQQGKAHVRLGQRQQKGISGPSREVITSSEPTTWHVQQKYVKTAMYIHLFLGVRDT